jgi:hypothetical protein
MNYLELFTALHSTFAEAEKRIRADTGYPKAIGFSIYGGDVYTVGGAIHFKIVTSYTSSFEAIEVRGRDFWDCVSEFTRRLSFAERQATVQLGPPTIDAEPQR